MVGKSEVLVSSMYVLAAASVSNCPLTAKQIITTPTREPITVREKGNQGTFWVQQVQDSPLNEEGSTYNGWA
jgi:hypothetical protein